MMAFQKRKNGNQRDIKRKEGNRRNDRKNEIKRKGGKRVINKNKAMKEDKKITGKEKYQ